MTVITSVDVDEAADPAVRVIAPPAVLTPPEPIVSGLCAVSVIGPVPVCTGLAPVVIAPVLSMLMAPAPMLVTLPSKIAPLLLMYMSPDVPLEAVRVLTWVFRGAAAVVPMPVRALRLRVDAVMAGAVVMLSVIAPAVVSVTSLLPAVIF